MSSLPASTCRRGACRLLAIAGSRYCAVHEADTPRRPSAHRRGYNQAWAFASRIFLAQNPRCAAHLQRGESVPSVLVDHIKPHRGDQQLFWDEDNWQALCMQCHNRKTAREDGGFGNRRGGSVDL